MRFKEYLVESGTITDFSFLITEGKTNQKLLEIGKRIAVQLKLKFNGWWKELNKFVFTDMEITGTTITARTFEEAQKKLAEKRKQFAAHPNNMALA